VRSNIGNNVARGLQPRVSLLGRVSLEADSEAERVTNQQGVAASTRGAVYFVGNSGVWVHNAKDDKDPIEPGSGSGTDQP
jgi:hypothetical protein